MLFLLDTIDHCFVENLFSAAPHDSRCEHFADYILNTYTNKTHFDGNRPFWISKLKQIKVIYKNHFSVTCINQFLLKFNLVFGPSFCGVRIARSLVFCVVDHCLFVVLSFFCPLCCLSFDLWLLITSLESSNIS
jgi:hypothetical protein